MTLAYNNERTILSNYLNTSALKMEAGIAFGYARLTALALGHLTFWGSSVANMHRYIIL